MIFLKEKYLIKLIKNFCVQTFFSLSLSFGLLSLRFYLCTNKFLVYCTNCKSFLFFSISFLPTFHFSPPSTSSLPSSFLSFSLYNLFSYYLFDIKLNYEKIIEWKKILYTQEFYYNLLIIYNQVQYIDKCQIWY